MHLVSIKRDIGNLYHNKNKPSQATSDADAINTGIESPTLAVTCPSLNMIIHSKNVLVYGWLTGWRCSVVMEDVHMKRV